MTVFMRNVLELVGSARSRQLKAEGNQAALQRIEKSFDSIWKAHGTLLRESRRYTSMVADFEASLAARDCSFRQFEDARAALPILETSSLQSRKLRSRLNRLVYKCRQFAKLAEVEDPKRKDAAYALLGVVRGIEVSVSDLAKTNELTLTKLTRALRGATQAAINAKADLQFSEGFVADAVSNYLRVLLGSRAQDEDRAHAARKLLALAVSLEDDSIASITRPFFQAASSKFNGRLSDIVPFISSLLVGSGSKELVQIHQAIALAKGAKTSEAALAAANLFINPDWLPEAIARELQSDWISFALDLDQLEQVRPALQDQGTILDSLVAEVPEDSHISGVERVTVLMPARNSANWIGTAIRSVLDQTWRSLELIVIDDASEDDTLKIATEFAKRDSRVQVIPLGKQRGAYGARNVGLDFASGEFITVHDADDWSHPRKIERQVKHLIQNPSIVANLSQSARVTDFNLKFQNYLGREILRQNSSSLMCRKEVFETLGYWDEVKFGADTEFHHRVLAAFGKDKAPVIQAGVLSFTRFHEASLTGGGSGSMAHGVAGARAEYAANFSAWHEENSGSPELLRLEKSASPRPFEVGVASSSNLESHSRPLLFVGDFVEDSRLWHLVQSLIGQLSSGQRVAIRHEPDSESPNSFVTIPETFESDRIEILERELDLEVDTLVIEASRVARKSARSTIVRARNVIVLGEITDQNGQTIFSASSSKSIHPEISETQLLQLLNELSESSTKATRTRKPRKKT